MKVSTTNLEVKEGVHPEFLHASLAPDLTEGEGSLPPGKDRRELLLWRALILLYGNHIRRLAMHVPH